MKVTIIPILIGAFGTVTKGLRKGLENLGVGGRAETIQTTILLRTARILRRVLETWGDFAFTQTPVKDYQLTLKWKTLMGNNNKNNNNREGDQRKQKEKQEHSN